jgi:hypothetical protein
VTRPNGVEIYHGPSAIDQADIVCLLVGLQSPSVNLKTGGMLQTYILRADAPPIEARKAGTDRSICGDCPMRGAGCYVNLGHGPHSVWHAWKRGRYPKVSGQRALELISGRALRIGTYGDPAAIPGCGSFWRDFAAAANRHTAYTHRWRDVGESLQGVCVASVDNAAELKHAWREGWSTFRVAPIGDRSRLPGEAYCPAAAESGKRVTCEACPIPCDGSVNGIRGRVIQAHGASARRIG